MKAILYARFSPRRDAENCESVKHQLSAIQEWCGREGHDVLDEYSDEALSGDDYNRPGLWASVAAVRRGYLLVVWKFDRLARDPFLSYSIERNVLKAGGRLVSASGEGTIEAGMSPGDELKIGILRVFARYEQQTIAAQTKAAMLRHQANGRRMSGECPYGQQIDVDSPENKRGRPAMMRTDPDEQEVLSLVKDLATQGLTARAIARELDRLGLRPRGTAWHHQTVLRMLRRDPA